MPDELPALEANNLRRAAADMQEPVESFVITQDADGDYFARCGSFEYELSRPWGET